MSSMQRVNYGIDADCDTNVDMIYKRQEPDRDMHDQAAADTLFRRCEGDRRR